MVALGELSRALGLKLDGPELREFVKAGLVKIARHQNPDGGFALWPGASSEIYVSAFALWGLHLAKKGGHDVNQQVIDDGIGYLRSPYHNLSASEPGRSQEGNLRGRGVSGVRAVGSWGNPASRTRPRCGP